MRERIRLAAGEMPQWLKHLVPLCKIKLLPLMASVELHRRRKMTTYFPGVDIGLGTSAAFLVHTEFPLTVGVLGAERI